MSTQNDYLLRLQKKVRELLQHRYNNERERFVVSKSLRNEVEESVRKKLKLIHRNYPREIKSGRKIEVEEKQNNITSCFISETFRDYIEKATEEGDYIDKYLTWCVPEYDVINFFLNQDNRGFDDRTKDYFSVFATGLGWNSFTKKDNEELFKLLFDEGNEQKTIHENYKSEEFIKRRDLIQDLSQTYYGIDSIQNWTEAEIKKNIDILVKDLLKRDLKKAKEDSLYLELENFFNEIIETDSLRNKNYELGLRIEQAILSKDNEEYKWNKKIVITYALIVSLFREFCEKKVHFLQQLINDGRKEVSESAFMGLLLVSIGFKNNRFRKKYLDKILHNLTITFAHKELAKIFFQVASTQINSMSSETKKMDFREFWLLLPFSRKNFFVKEKIEKINRRVNIDLLVDCLEADFTQSSYFKYQFIIKLEYNAKKLEQKHIDQLVDFIKKHPTLLENPTSKIYYDTFFLIKNLYPILISHGLKKQIKFSNEDATFYSKYLNTSLYIHDFINEKYAKISGSLTLEKIKQTDVNKLYFIIHSLNYLKKYRPIPYCIDSIIERRNKEFFNYDPEQKWHSLGILSKEFNEFKSADICFTTALEFCPHMTEALRDSLLFYAFESADVKGAEEIFKKILSLGSLSHRGADLLGASACYLLACNSFHYNEHEIIQFISEALAKEKTNSYALLATSIYYLLKGDLENSKRYLLDSTYCNEVKKGTAMPYIYEVRACLYLEQNKFAEAHSILTMHCLGYSILSIYFMGSYFLRIGDVENVSDLLTQHSKFKHNPLYHFLSAKLKFQNKEYPKAIVDFEFNIRLFDPINYREVFEYLLKTFLRTNKIKNSIEALNLLMSEHKNERTQIYLHFIRALMSSIDIKSQKEAKEAFRVELFQLIDTHSSDWSTHFMNEFMNHCIYVLNKNIKELSRYNISPEMCSEFSITIKEIAEARKLTSD